MEALREQDPEGYASLKRMLDDPSPARLGGAVKEGTGLVRPLATYFTEGAGAAAVDGMATKTRVPEPYIEHLADARRDLPKRRPRRVVEDQPKRFSFRRIYRRKRTREQEERVVGATAGVFSAAATLLGDQTHAHLSKSLLEDAAVVAGVLYWWETFHRDPPSGRSMRGLGGVGGSLQVRVYDCPFCLQSFASASAFRAHIETAHLGDERQAP